MIICFQEEQLTNPNGEYYILQNSNGEFTLDMDEDSSELFFVADAHGGVLNLLIAKGILRPTSEFIPESLFFAEVLYLNKDWLDPGYGKVDIELLLISLNSRSENILPNSTLKQDLENWPEFVLDFGEFLEEYAKKSILEGHFFLINKIKGRKLMFNSNYPLVHLLYKFLLREVCVQCWDGRVNEWVNQEILPEFETLSEFFYIEPNTWNPQSRASIGSMHGWFNSHLFKIDNHVTLTIDAIRKKYTKDFNPTTEIFLTLKENSRPIPKAEIVYSVNKINASIRLKKLNIPTVVSLGCVTASLAASCYVDECSQDSATIMLVIDSFF